MINPVTPFLSDDKKKEIRNCTIIKNLYSRGSMGTFHLLLNACSVTLNSIFTLNSTLSSATNADDKTLLFEIVFIIVWVGAGVISING